MNVTGLQNHRIWHPMKTTTRARHNIGKTHGINDHFPLAKNGCTMHVELNNKQCGSCPKP